MFHVNPLLRLGLFLSCLNRGGSLVPPPRPYFLGQRKIFWKEVFFVHLHTAVQKRPSRGSEKMFTYIFQTSRTENRAKKGSFSSNFGPKMAKTAKMAHFGPFWPFFGDCGDFLRIELPTLNPTSPWTPKVVFEVPGI